MRVPPSPFVTPTATAELDEITGTGPCLLLFSSPSCIACGPYEELLAAAAREHPQVPVVRIDADTAGTDLLDRYQVKVVPVLVVLVDGARTATRTGAATPSQLAELFERAATAAA